MNRFDRQLPQGLRIWKPEPIADLRPDAEAGPDAGSGSQSSSPQAPSSPQPDAPEASLESDSKRSARTERELDRLTGIAPAKTRTVPLKAFVPLLVDAQEQDSAWLVDFQDDNVVIDADLHEVLLAYQDFRNRRDAA